MWKTLAVTVMTGITVTAAAVSGEITQVPIAGIWRYAETTLRSPVEEIVLEYCPRAAGNVQRLPPVERGKRGCFQISVTPQQFLPQERVGIVALYNIVMRRGKGFFSVAMYDQHGAPVVRAVLMVRGDRKILERVFLGGGKTLTVFTPWGEPIGEAVIFRLIEMKKIKRRTAPLMGDITMSSCRKRGAGMGEELLRQKNSAVMGALLRRNAPPEQYPLGRVYCIPRGAPRPPLVGTSL